MRDWVKVFTFILFRLGVYLGLLWHGVDVSPNGVSPRKFRVEEGGE